jgi:hypothetical protein
MAWRRCARCGKLKGLDAGRALTAELFRRRIKATGSTGACGEALFAV